MSLSVSEIMNPTKPESGDAQIVIFSLAGCEAGVPIRQVREIIRIGEIAMMPKAPPFLEGIINLRGKIIPVLDLKKRFRMPLTDRTDESRILIVEINEQMLGFLVDKVVEVLKVSPSLVEPAKDSVLNIEPEFIEGCVALDRRLVLLLNLKKLLTIDDTKTLPDRETEHHVEGKSIGH